MLGRVPIPPLVMCMTFSLRTEKGETDAQINADNCAGGGGGGGGKTKITLLFGIIANSLWHA